MREREPRQNGLEGRIQLLRGEHEARRSRQTQGGPSVFEQRRQRRPHGLNGVEHCAEVGQAESTPNGRQDRLALRIHTQQVEHLPISAAQRPDATRAQRERPGQERYRSRSNAFLAFAQAPVVEALAKLSFQRVEAGTELVGREHHTRTLRHEGGQNDALFRDSQHRHATGQQRELDAATDRTHAAAVLHGQSLEGARGALVENPRVRIRELGDHL